MLNNNPHIYLISDSTGETVSIVARSVYADLKILILMKVDGHL